MGASVKILVAGSGPAALEATLALSASEHLVAEIALVSPQTEYLYRPNLVMEPFGVAPTTQYSVGEIIQHERVQQWLGTIDRVDAESGRAFSPEGDVFEFDALLLATGTRPRALLSGPAITMGMPGSIDQLKDVIAGIADGTIGNVVFTKPDGPSFPIPLYELALMTADRAAAQGERQVSVGIVTPEHLPLEIFGAKHAAEVARLCEQLGTRVQLSQTVESYDGTLMHLSGGGTAEADRLIAMPLLEPVVPDGIARADDGFVPVDEHQLVSGTDNVWAAGDVTDFPVKQGGLATREADAASAAIEHALGVRPDADPVDPVIEAVLLTARKRIGLRARVTAGGSESLAAEGPAGPARKIFSRLLADRLHQLAPLG